MVKLIWSPSAVADLEEICEYIAKDSEYYAKIFIQRIVVLVEKIPNFPKAGRIVPEYKRPELRERIFQNYRVVYRIKPKAVEIVAIVYGARLLTKIRRRVKL